MKFDQYTFSTLYSILNIQKYSDFERTNGKLAWNFALSFFSTNHFLDGFEICTDELPINSKYTYVDEMKMKNLFQFQKSTEPKVKFGKFWFCDFFKK